MPTDGAPRHRIGIIHVAKCAGTSIRSALAIPRVYQGPIYFDWRGQGWGSHRQRYNGFSDERMQQFTDPIGLRSVWDEHSVVVGHYTAETLSQSGAERLIATVREPRSRLLSTYCFWKQHGSNLAHGWGLWGQVTEAATMGSFSDFLRHKGIWPATQGRIARQVLEFGRIGRWTRHAPQPDRILRRMRANYPRVLDKLDSAFWSNEGTLLLARVRSLADIDPLIYQSTNVTPPGLATGQRLTHSDLDALDELTAQDRWLLDRLMRDQLLSLRSQAELDDEFAETCSRHAIRLP